MDDISAIIYIFASSLAVMALIVVAYVMTLLTSGRADG